MAGNVSHNLSLESKEEVWGWAEDLGESNFFFTGGREGRLVVANKVCREDYTIECQLTGNEGGGGHITVRISLFVPPPLVQVPVLNVEKPNFLTFFFPRLYPIYSGGAHYSEAKKRGKASY